MNPEEFVTFARRVMAPMVVVATPIFLILMVLAGLHARGTSEQLSAAQWIFVVVTCAIGFVFALRVCIEEYGWFQKENNDVPKNDEDRSAGTQ